MADSGFLRQHPLFADVAPEDLAALEKAARVRTYQDGEVIFHQEDLGDGLHIVKTGSVKISIGASEGQESLIAIMFPGDCFGELAVLDGLPRSAAAIAMGRTETYFIRRADFLAFVERCPRVAMKLIFLLCHRLRRTDEQLADLVFFDVYGRVAKKLLDLARLHGVKTSKGIEINLNITQQDLANLVGASRESVNKVMRFYRDMGYVAQVSQRITILRQQGLEQRVV